MLNYQRVLEMIHKLQVLVFAADLLERWTHGAVCSCRHRVRAPAHSAGRLSLVYDSWAVLLNQQNGASTSQKECLASKKNGFLTDKHGGVTNKGWTTQTCGLTDTKHRVSSARMMIPGGNHTNWILANTRNDELCPVRDFSVYPNLENKNRTQKRTCSIGRKTRYTQIS